MHKFNPEHASKLESPERYKLIPPKETLVSLGLKEGMTAAEIGCGSGFFAIAASDILKDDGKIYAFDTEEKMLTLLRTRLEKPNVVPILSTENKLPLKDKLLDFVLIAFVLHEATDINIFLKEAKRVIKHDGIIAIIDWIKQSEEHGPPEQERLSQNDVVSHLKELDIVIQRADQLNPSHYAVVGTIIH